MAQVMRQAIDVTRENGAVVSTNSDDSTVYITFTESVPLEADKLIRNDGWMILPSSARKPEVVVFKRR